MIYFVSFNPNLIGIALSSAALGGFLHEFLQSKGTIIFIQQRSDGLYLGSAAGFVFGMVSGVFIIQANIVAFDSTDPEDIIRVFFEAFLAGLALKGAADAAAGNLKTKDEFQITAVNLNAETADVWIKNDSQYSIHIQQITATHDATRRTDASIVSPPHDRVLPATAPKIRVAFDQIRFVRGQTYSVVVHSRNARQEKSVTA